MDQREVSPAGSAVGAFSRQNGSAAANGEWLRFLAHAISDARLEDFDDRTLTAARKCLLDCLASAAAGTRHETFSKSLPWTKAVFGPGQASLWFTGHRLSPVGAAYINANSASVLDVDDGHRAASGHPGSAVIPAVLAMTDATHSAGEILLAIICGYEAGIRIARARQPSLGVATGRWSAIAAAAGAAKLANLPAVQIAAALSIAEPLASNLAAADQLGFIGGEIKEGIPWSVVVGLCAVHQARAGLTGYTGALENRDIYLLDREDQPFGTEALINSVYFKRYACCRWIHSAVDAAIGLRRDGYAPAAIERLTVHTFQRAASLPNEVRPRDLISAQFSIPFVVAAALLDGPEALAPMDPNLLKREDIVSLAAKISVKVDDQLDRMFPAQVPARIEVETSSDLIVRGVEYPRGDPANPMTDLEFLAKAKTLLSQAVAEEEACEICDAMMNGAFDLTAPIDPLLTILNARQRGSDAI